MTSEDDLQHLIDLRDRGLLSEEELATATRRLAATAPVPEASSTDAPSGGLVLTPEQEAYAAEHRARVASGRWRGRILGSVFLALMLAIPGTALFPRAQYLASPFLCLGDSRAKVSSETYVANDGGRVLETELACISPDGTTDVVHAAQVIAVLTFVYLLAIWLTAGLIRLTRSRAPGSRPLAAP